MGTRSNPGKFDSYHVADPQEPMFTLIGRDRLAGWLVMLWAGVRRAWGESDEVCDEAIKVAHDMNEWMFKMGREITDQQAMVVLEVLNISMDAWLELLRERGYNATSGLAEDGRPFIRVSQVDHQGG